MRLLGVILLLGASPVWADALSEARDRHRQGLALYDLGRFAEAAAKIEEAFVLRDEPGLLLDSGLAWRRAGNYNAALRVYRGYLRRAIAGSAMIDSISQCVEDLQNAARRASPRGCNRDPIPIVWEAAPVPPAPTKPPARPASAPVADVDDDEPPRPPARAAAQPAPVAATSLPERTVYDPWHGKITRVAAQSHVPTPATAPPTHEPTPAPATAPPPLTEPLITPPAPIEPVVTQVARAPEPPRPRVPYYKTAWFWTTMVLVAGTVVGVGVGIGFAGNEFTTCVVPGNVDTGLNCTGNADCKANNNCVNGICRRNCHLDINDCGGSASRPVFCTAFQGGGNINFGFCCPEAGC